MRKVILSAAISIDGYIARPNGEVDFLIMPEDLSVMAEFFSSLDVILMGRKTYEMSLKMVALLALAETHTYFHEASHRESATALFGLASLLLNLWKPFARTQARIFS